MKDTIVYQNDQPVPVLPCLQRPDVLLRIREGAVIVIDVKEESSLHKVYRLPLGSVSFVVLNVEEASVSLGKEFFVTCEAGTRKENPLCSFGRFSFLLSALDAYQAVIDQPEMLLECWDESPDVVAVKGKAVPLMVVPPEQEQEEKTEPPEQDPLQALKVGDWIARQDNTGTTLAVIRDVWRADPDDLLCMSAEYLLISTGQQPGEVFSCSVESLKKIGWKILEGSTEISPPVREQITLNEPQEPDLWKQLDHDLQLQADALHNELHTQTQPDRELLRDMQNLLHDAWDGWGGDEGLTDREIIALVGLRVVGTLLRKNADYGCSVWKAPVLAPDVNPLKAMLCRTSDKVERIATLSAGAQPQVVGEGLKDSILDNAGYSILMLGYILKQEMAAGKLAGKGAHHGEV